MKLSQENLNTFLLHIHKTIEETADSTATSLAQHTAGDAITYPPKGGLSDAEIDALKSIRYSEALKMGLGKVIADACASVVFDMMSIIDGVTDPELDMDNWQGIKLVDDSDDLEDAGDLMLHDQFYESYWDWDARRDSDDE
jgi:hypothetical protein